MIDLNKINNVGDFLEECSKEFGDFFLRNNDVCYLFLNGSELQFINHVDQVDKKHIVWSVKFDFWKRGFFTRTWDNLGTVFLNYKKKVNQNSCQSAH